MSSLGMRSGVKSYSSVLKESLQQEVGGMGVFKGILILYQFEKSVKFNWAGSGMDLNSHFP